MIWHQYLNSIGNHDFWFFNSAFLNIVQFLYKVWNIKCYTRSYYVYCVFIKYTGWHLMERKFTIIVYYCVARIASTLKSNNNISLSSKHICNFTFSFIAPIGTNNCFDHSDHSHLIYNNKINLRLIISLTYTKSKITIFYICHKKSE
ncbi:hypothetical protein SDC9_120440 [bioreactor metagenome]|uniref:Uncharacterized protein n=1 Tax=bioreactor metagenome TaxID=1076179 RepID=A0A645C6T7_9ZZZZ